MSAEPITETAREPHLFDFRGGPIVIWVPRLAEMLQAKVMAATMLAEDLGPNAEPDHETLTVGLPTICLLALVCRDAKDPAGWPYFASPLALLDTVDIDGQAVLLDLLNAAVLKERGPEEGDDLDMMTAIADCDSVAEVLEMLAGWPHPRVVKLLWDMARITRIAVEARPSSE